MPGWGPITCASRASRRDPPLGSDRHRLGPTWRLLHDHQTRDDAGRVVGYRNLDRIGATLAPILLRRRKAEVLKQLPERIDNTLFVPMTPQQQTHHEENREAVARIVAKWRRYKFLSEADQRREGVVLHTNDFLSLERRLPSLSMLTTSRV